MSSCTYKFKNASGEEVTITGQADMKAFLANGGLEQLLPGKVLPWRSAEAARKTQIDKEYAHLPEGNRPPAFQYGEGLEPWQIDSAEFSKQRNGNPHFDQSGFRTDGDYLRASNNAHKKLVAQAVAEGKPVPASVLAEYPDLKQSKGEPTAPAESPAVEPAEDRVLTIDDIDTLVAGLNDGTVSADAYKAAWQAFQKSADTIKAGLHKLTKSQLLDKVGGILAYRMKGENKPDIVNAVFDAARNVFSLGRDYGPQGYFMGEYEEYKEAQKKAFADMIDATTDEDLKAYADKIAEANAERRQAANALEKAIQNPQTLDDFRKYVTAKLRQGMSESEVRMSLTPDQRAKMDDLHAEDTRKGRASRPAPAVTAASVTTGGDIVATKHTKTGEDLYVVRPAERVERDQYNIWNATAKRMGGWYSSFRGNGAVPGFQFKTRESADAFLAYIGGDTEGAKQVAQERRDAFSDDRSQSAVERLTEMADRLEDRADESLSRDRKANTARRASMAASAEASANADKAMARTMRNIANAIKDGKAKFLDKVRQKVQVEMLASFVRDAKYSELTKRYPSYADFERNRYEKPTSETADYAAFPKYTADRADLARMGREMELVEGSKKMGQRLLKVADDATDEYLKFVKANLNKVSTFRLKDGSPAIYSSRDDAESAIARSGFRGKAMVFSVKRGQNLVVMGPAMAKENGLWTADTGKRITLTDEAGEEITAKAESMNRNREKVYLPHQFSATRERRAKLKAMGIESAAEFRAALREFIALSEAPERPSRVKELERAMVGRRNDGLDFFPTPSGVAQQMIEAAGIEEGMSVLEPSAGMGHIAEQIRETGVDPDVVEFSADRRELLEAKGFNVVANDFMEASGEYDRIVMNPPFSGRRDAEHVRHAFDLLKPGGRIVAIMGEGVFFGQDKKAESFREWLDSVGGSSEKLPDGTFIDPSLPVNTATNARLVVIDKPADAGPTSLYEIDKNGDPSPEEAEAVQRGLEGKNPIEAAAWLAENAPMKFAVIAEKVRDKLQSLADAGVNFGLSIVRPGDLGEAGLSVARGVTAPVRNGDRVDIRIALNGAGMTGRVGTSYRTATHELAHAATMQSVQLGMSGFPQYAQAVRDLVDVANAIGDHLRSRMKADKETWTDFERAVFEKRANFMRSVDEVLVWGMTSPEAQAYLESIPYKSKSLWTSFVEAVRKVLGLSAHNDTALSEVLRIADVLLKPIDMDSLAGFVGLDSQYEIQQPYGGRVFKNPGGVPDAKWTGEAVDEGAARLSEHTAVLRTDTLPDTITVNGVERPTTNSKGQPIHPTEEGLRNFWKWFSPSPGQLLDGFSVSEISGLKRDTKALADFIESQSGISKSDRFTVIPSSVFAHVAGAVNNGKILDAVVRSLPVDVVNFLGGKKGSAKEVLHNAAMLEQVFSVDPASDVSLGVNPSGIAELLVRMVANAGAKISGVTSGALERNATVLADTNYPILGGHIRANQKRDLSIIAGFGDSKVVDAEGRPLVVYHGTGTDFDRFDLGLVGRTFGTAADELGFFFSSNPETASKYAINAGHGGGGNVMPVYVRIADPLSRSNNFLRGPIGFLDWNRSSLKQQAESNRNDGILIRQKEDGEIHESIVVAFRPEQIKSAIGNAGTFDPANPDIRLRDTSALRDGESIPRDQAEAFIRSFVAEFPGAPPIMLADSFSQLPKELQADAISQGSSARRAKGALKDGKAFVVLNNHHSMADLEATVFHEILGHTGIRKLLGPQFSQELNKLFVGLGGYSGLERIMEARGMGQQFEGYFRGIQQARASNPDAWTDALAKSILTEEVFAHIAEQKNAKQLRDRFMALVGMVRDWLRRHGFMDLASLGESDIVFMLQHAREGLRDGSGIVRDGATVGENEIIGEDGRPIAKEGSPEYEALKLLSGRLGLRERSGPTVFKDGLRDDGNEGQDAGMDDANNVAGKQAPNPAGDVEQGSAKKEAVDLTFEQSASARPDVAVFRTDTSPRGKAADDVFLRTINTAGGRKTVRDHVAEAFSNITGESAKTFNWWQRTVGSQYGKAKSDKDFGRVYDAAHAFLDGVSAFAKEASERASGILPHLDTWRDVSAGLNVKKQWADSQDYQAIAPAIFDGTLANGTTGKVWTDEQLRDKYSLNDKQIGHYREFRAAVDFSLETLAASEMARLARASKMEVADRDMGMPDALAFYTDQLQGKIDAIQQAREDAELRHSVERENMADLLASIPNEKTRAESLRLMEERQAEEMAKLDKASKPLEELQGSFNDKSRQIRKLQSEGYAPLMRFGQYTVDVARLDDEGHPLLDEDGNPDRPFFGMFESESEARKAEKILTEEYPGYSVTRGVLSTEANQLYRGLTPETAEMFARLLGTDENEAFQAYLKQAVANRSAMKRLINRMGIEGFATDVPRVLSAFITSNARLSSGNWYFGEMSKAVEAIPKHKGDVKTDAVKLMQYVQNPVEEAAGLRGFLFFSFLGGSVASAVVNLTQTFTTTLPYLSQFGAGDVAKALPKAMALSGRMMKKGLDAVSDKDLKDALRKASDEGVVDPQEIHLLMAEASGNGASVGLSGLAGAINKEWATPAARVTRSLTQAWGMLFGAAEKYNRHVAFIAAWEVAPEGVDRYEFAKNAVTETQFDYTKASRPNWARGAVGATLFTFKTFSINYVEFMSRLPPRERAIALGVLFLLAGMSGMPGADDLDDVVDTVAQKMGYNWNNTAARHAWLVRTLGTGGADFVERGVSSMLPLDVSARLGMGNLVPGTGVLQKSNTSPVRDVQEFFGPAGSVVAGFRDVFDNAGSGKGIIDTALPLMPKMFKDLHQAVDMVQTGQYRDMKGRKVVDVDGVDAVLKGIGFQPNSVASPRRVERMLAQSAGMQRVIRQDISELWARGVAEQDAEKVASARTILREWNEKNPESKITMNPASIAQRVRAMRLTSADRLVKATPKDMRGALAAEMAVQQ